MRRLMVIGLLVAVAGCAASSSTPEDPGPSGPAAQRSARVVRHPAPKAPQQSPQATHHLIVAGDSLAGDLGHLLTSALAGPGFVGETESHASSGLVRDDFFDWPAAARQVAAERPDTVVLVLGGNDNQPIQTPTAIFAPASPGWRAEYTRRAAMVMQALRDGGVRTVVWLTMPRTTRPGMSVAVAAMGQSLHDAARGRAGVTVYDSDTLLGDIAGTPVAHQSDGIHLSTLGSQRIAYYLLVKRLRAGTSS